MKFCFIQQRILIGFCSRGRVSFTYQVKVDRLFIVRTEQQH